MFREYSLALYHLGRASEAADCIREAVVLAQHGTDANSLSQIYSVARTIMCNALPSSPVFPHA